MSCFDDTQHDTELVEVSSFFREGNPACKSREDVMKNKKINNLVQKIGSPKDGQHSFLFWLVVPLIILWLVIGYVFGSVSDTPIWRSVQNYSTTNPANPFFKDYAALPNNTDGYITFWFDDAWLSQYMVAYPLMKEAGLKGTIAVPVVAIGQKDYMNWAQLRIIQDDGWEIANHSLKHDCNMQSLSEDQIKTDLTTARNILWSQKLSATVFVPPCGVDSPTLRSEASKLFQGYRTVDPGFNPVDTLDPYNMKVKNIENNTKVDDIKLWIDQTKKDKAWLILLFHKVGEPIKDVNSERYDINKDDFEDIIKYVQENNITVITPSQIINKS